MNRADRRALAKRLHVDYMFVTALERMMQEEVDVAELAAGQKVKVNAEKVLGVKIKLKPKYRQWVIDHQDEVFTVEVPDGAGKHICTLAEDTTEPKWFWKTSDLIVVK